MQWKVRREFGKSLISSAALSVVGSQGSAEVEEFNPENGSYEFIAASADIDLSEFADPRAELEWRTWQAYLAHKSFCQSFTDNVASEVLRGRVQVWYDGRALTLGRVSEGWKFSLRTEKGRVEGVVASILDAESMACQCLATMGPSEEM